MFNCKKQNIAVFLMLLAVVMLLPCSSVLFAIERKSDKASIDDFVIADESAAVSSASATTGTPEAPSAEKEAAVVKFDADENSVEGEEAGDEEEDEERELTPEEQAALEAEEAAREAAIENRAKELEEEVKKIGNNSPQIVELLTDSKNDEALQKSRFLLERLIESLLNENKLNYNEIGRYGKDLCRADRASSLGLYAQGLQAMNARKPDLKKAMEFFDKARKAKKPYRDAASAYTYCLINRFLWYAVSGLVILINIIVFVIWKIKKKKAAQALEKIEDSDTSVIDGTDLQKLLDGLDDTEKAETDAVKTDDATGDKSSDAKPVEEQKPVVPETGNIGFPTQETVGAYNPFARNSTPAKSVAPEKQSEPSLQSIQTNQGGQTSAQPETASGTANVSINAAQNVAPTPVTAAPGADGQTTTVTQTADGKRIVRVVKKVRVRRDANGNTYVVQDGNNPSVSSYQTSSQQQAELDEIRGISRPESKPLPPVDTQLDILWGNLSRKAMQGHISPMYRKADSTQAPLPTTTVGGPIAGGHSYFGENHSVGDIRLGDVSIDLSEEALKDDLVGKLKMLAITDSELRELFAMKNPAHIPPLIEYIMTKPEPMRLAFVAKELGNYGDPAVVDALASLLYHEDERVVLAAIQGLEATKSNAAVIPLCPFLRSEIPLYAQAARTAMSKFGAVKIMQALKDLPSFSDIKVKEAGIFVLSRMKGDPVEKILKSLLNDESSSVRIQTILAMSYQKNPVYIDSLREFYRIASEAEKSMTRKAIVYLQGFNN